jgi:hypothetical protein
LSSPPLLHVINGVRVVHFVLVCVSVFLVVIAPSVFSNVYLVHTYHMTLNNQGRS